MTSIAVALSSLSVGPARSAGRLTTFPFLTAVPADPSYLMLDQALASGVASITEVSASGSVPELKFENRSDRPVLIVDGEALIGAKQNRIVNITILVPAQTVTTIPVSCVERGRWSYRRPDFMSTDHVLYSQSRAQRAVEVSASLRATGRARSDQGAIWNGIAAKAVRMSSESQSEAMEAMYERRHRDLEVLESRLAPEPNEIGAAFALDGRLVGLEMFDSAATWRRFARKIFRSYGLDALDDGVRIGDAPTGIEEWLHSLASIPIEEFPAVGLGQDLRFDHPRFSGGALVVGQTVVHCVAFDATAWS